jgi:hypothetical protein
VTFGTFATFTVTFTVLSVFLGCVHFTFPSSWPPHFSFHTDSQSLPQQSPPAPLLLTDGKHLAFNVCTLLQELLLYFLHFYFTFSPEMSQQFFSFRLVTMWEGVQVRYVMRSCSHEGFTQIIQIASSSKLFSPIFSNISKLEKVKPIVKFRQTCKSSERKVKVPNAKAAKPEPADEGTKKLVGILMTN